MEKIQQALEKARAQRKGLDNKANSRQSHNGDAKPPGDIQTKTIEGHTGTTA